MQAGTLWILERPLERDLRNGEKGQRRRVVKLRGVLGGTRSRLFDKCSFSLSFSCWYYVPLFFLFSFSLSFDLSDNVPGHEDYDDE